MVPDRIIELDVREDDVDHLPGDSLGVVYSEQLVERVLTEFTTPGDLVLDPFAGFGTTLVVARRMGRRSIGVELLPERVAFISELLEHTLSTNGRTEAATVVIEHDALGLETLALAPIDFSLSSPPYMTIDNHPENPLDGYRSQGGDYDSYLDDLCHVYGQVARRLVPDGLVVINVATLVIDGEATPLAIDLAARLTRVVDIDEVVEVRGACTASWLGADYLLVCSPKS